MIADARADLGHWHAPTLNVSQQKRLGCSEFCLEFLIDVQVNSMTDPSQALSNGLELLGCSVVVDGVMDRSTLGCRCLAVG